MSGLGTQRLLQVNRRAALLAGAVVFLVLTAPVALGLGYFGLDFARIGMATLCLLREATQDTGSPWLSPLTGNGLPLWADPQAQVLHPLSWPFVLLPPDTGAALRHALDLALGAGGTVLLLRSFGVAPASAVAGGVAFALGGPAADLMRHDQYSAGVLLAPAWAALRRSRHPALRRRSLRALWAWSLLLLLSSEAQAFGVLCALAAAEAVVGVRSMRAGVHARLMLRWCAVLGASVLCALPVWLTTLAELALGGRAAGFSTTESMAWQLLAPNGMAMLVNGAADVLMVPFSEALLWPGAWNANPYVGAPLVALALVGMGVRRMRVAALMATGLLLAALGDQTPFFPALVRVVPPLALFRYPEKYVLPLSLMLVVLAWVALEGARRRAAVSARATLSVLAMGTGLVLVACVAAFTQDHWAGALPEDTPGTLGLGVVRSAALCGVVGWLLWRRRAGRLAAVAACVLAADVVLSSVEHLNVGPPLADVRSPLTTLRSPPPGPAVRVCMSQRLERLTPAGSAADGPWMKALLERVAALPNINACQGLRVGTAYSTLVSRTNAALTGGVTAGRVGAARALGCTHAVLSVAPVDEPAAEVDLGVFTQAGGEEGRPVRVVTVVDPVPEAFVVRDPTAASEQAALERLTECHSAACALAVVDDPARRLPTTWTPPAGSGAMAPTWTHTDPAAWTLRMDGTGGALVGVNTAFQLGWEASQAGRALPVVRVSASFPAAVVEDVARGPVEFRYRPPRLLLGVLAALLGVLLGALALRGSGRVTGRSPRRPDGAPR